MKSWKIVQTTPEKPLLSPSVHKKLSWPKWVLIIATLAVLINAGIYVYLHSAKNQKQIPKQTPLLPTSVMPTIDISTNWKTYTNTIYKVSFSYPPELSLQEQNNGPQQFIVKLGS